MANGDISAATFQTNVLRARWIDRGAGIATTFSELLSIDRLA
jgi:hypothetical protein